MEIYRSTHRYSCLDARRSRPDLSTYSARGWGAPWILDSACLGLPHSHLLVARASPSASRGSAKSCESRATQPVIVTKLHGLARAQDLPSPCQTVRSVQARDCRYGDSASLQGGNSASACHRRGLRRWSQPHPTVSRAPHASCVGGGPGWCTPMSSPGRPFASRRRRSRLLQT